MNPWAFWFPPLNRGAPPGDLTQWIAPNTTWFSPQFNFAGSRSVEAEVVANHASYGRQLGWLVEAVLALAGDSALPEIEQLRDLDRDVEAVKERHQADALSAARDALERLRAADPAAFEVLVRSYST